MKKLFLLMLLCAAFFSVKAQDSLYLFNKTKLAVKNDNNVFKLILVKEDKSEISKPLKDSSYSKKAKFDTVYSALITQANGIDASFVGNSDKQNEVYKNLKAYYEKNWLAQYKVIDTGKTSLKAKISSSLTWEFKRIDKQFEMQLCKTVNNNLTCRVADSMDMHVSNFEIYISKNVVNRTIDSLKDSLTKADHITGNATDQLNFLKKNIYADLTKWLSDKNGLINVNKLTYNDSLKAEITVNPELPIYQVFIKSKASGAENKPKTPDGKNEKSVGNSPNGNGNIGTTKYQPDDVEVDSLKYRNRLVGKVKILNAKVQVYDGFLLSITFDIDTADARKYSLKTSQTIRGGYNIRNVMFAKEHLTNSIPNYLKKEISSFASFDSQDKHKYIYLIDELIDFKTPVKAPNAIFTAEEKLLTIEKDQLGKPVPIKEKSLYSFASLDIYSDLLGLFNENNPNGLVQSELKIGTALFRKPLFGKSYRDPGDVAALTPFNKAEIFFKFSKLDDKIRYLGVQRTAADTPYVHGINLLQYQSMNYGVRANLLNLDYRGGYTSIIGEASIYRTPLRDSTKTKQGNILIKTPETFGINSTALSIGLNSRIHAASFLDIDFGARYIYVKPRVDSLKISNTEYNEFYMNNRYVPASSVKIIDYKAMTNIYLNDEKSKRIIIRFEYFFDMKQTSNNFSTLQVGYSAALDKFLKL
jgi:hypothetical protein